MSALPPGSAEPQPPALPAQSPLHSGATALRARPRGEEPRGPEGWGAGAGHGAAPRGQGPVPPWLRLHGDPPRPPPARRDRSRLGSARLGPARSHRPGLPEPAPHREAPQPELAAGPGRPPGGTATAVPVSPPSSTPGHPPRPGELPAAARPAPHPGGASGKRQGLGEALRGREPGDGAEGRGERGVRARAAPKGVPKVVEPSCRFKGG